MEILTTPSTKSDLVVIPSPPADRGLHAAHASACGKAILIGEHAVVYGARAVAMPMTSRRLLVSITPLSSPQTSKICVDGVEVPSHLYEVLAEAFAVLGVAPFPVAIDGTSNLATGAGLGSSAALCVALLRGIAAAADLTFLPGDLARLGNELERRFHGNPSGLDAAVVALEQVISFRRGESPNPVRVRHPGGPDRRAGRWTFALLDTKTRASTYVMVERARPYFLGTSGPQRIQDFDRLAAEALAGLASADLPRVAAAMNESQVLLEAAGVASEPIVQLIGLARRVGCPAAKLTGAGGGGCVLALLNPDRADSEFAAIESLMNGHVHRLELP